MPKLLDLKGKKFGRWTVQQYLRLNKHNKAVWRCRCDCGIISEVIGVNLTWGISESCGCLRTERQSERIAKQNFKHGHAMRGQFSAEYLTWIRMLQRCEMPSSKKFYRYHAGMGVRVCAKWRRSFTAFLADIGLKPTPQHSIDRYPDPNGDYKPGNVRWATPREQIRNRR